MNRYEINWENIPETRWADGIPRFLDSVCIIAGIDHCEISLTFCDNSIITELNSKFRQKSEPTDVLTFPQFEPEDFFIPLVEDIDFFQPAGDIVISLQYVEENAEYFKVTYEEELRRVIIHGILHLKGLNHQSNDADEPMLIFQEEILTSTKDVPLFL